MPPLLRSLSPSKPNQLASTSKSLAVLAIRTRTPVIPIFIYRERFGEHRVEMQPAVDTEAPGDSEDVINELTQRCTAAIEAAVRVAPEQWLWVHNRWRTKPAATERVER